MAKQPKAWIHSLLLVLLLWTIYLIPLDHVPTDDTLPNELLPISLINEGDFDFDEFHQFTDRRPLSYCFHERGGRIISNYPIMPGLLNLPVYLAARAAGVDIYRQRNKLSIISSALIAALSALFMYLCLLSVCESRNVAFFFTLNYAFATSVWSVASRGIWQHGPSLLLLNIAFYALLRRKVPLAGFFLGMAVFNRPVNFVIVLPLVVYVYRHRREHFAAFLGMAAIPAALLCLYSYTYCGSIAALGQGQGCAGFTGHFWPGLAGLLLSPSRGLLVFSPIFLFGLGYLPFALFKKQMEPLYRYMAAAVVLFVMLYAKWGMWWGGHCFGYRLLTEGVPILIILTALCWKAIAQTRWKLRLVYEFLLFLSVGIHALGVCCYPSGFDCIPNSIDQHTERLWSVRDSELARCARNFVKGVSHPKHTDPENKLPR